MTSKYMFSLINKNNFIGISRLFNEAVFNTRRGEITQKFNKIFLPFGNLDFVPSLRYGSSTYMNKFSSPSLDLGQNQDFNLVKIYI